MKKIITENIIEGVRKLGAVKSFFEFIEASYVEAFRDFIFGLLASTNLPTALFGCLNSGSGSNYNISAGSIWYNGEVFTIPAFVGVAPGGQVPVLALLETKTQLQYTDATSQDTLNNRTLLWQFGAAGSGLGNFSDLATLKGRIDVLTDLPARLTTAKNEVKNEILNGAGASLDTLKELADALGNDANFAATITAGLAGKVPNTRTIGTGAGLQGGGDLTANRTLSIPNGGVSEAMLADKYLKSFNATSHQYVQIDIGDWNMDTTFDKKISLAGITTWDKVRSINVLIRDDGATSLWNLANPGNTYAIDGASWAAGEVVFGPNHIYLTRKNAGFFDNSSFQATGFNRGFVTVVYEA